MREPAAHVKIVSMDGEEVDGPEWITTESGEHIPLGTGEGLTFARLSEQNLSRVHRWHKNFHSAHSKWTGADWSNATCGEAGEMANVVKKIRRQETGSDRGPDDPDMPRLREMLADEIADVVTYADLLAQYYEIDLAAAVAAKFNRISERQGFPERL